AQAVDRHAERLDVSEQGGDVPEDHARPRKIRDVPDVFLQPADVVNHYSTVSGGGRADSTGCVREAGARGRFDDRPGATGPAFPPPPLFAGPGRGPVGAARCRPGRLLAFGRLGLSPVAVATPTIGRHDGRLGQLVGAFIATLVELRRR